MKDVSKTTLLVEITPEEAVAINGGDGHKKDKYDKWKKYDKYDKYDKHGKHGYKCY
jgi:hypothetical protein